MNKWWLVITIIVILYMVVNESERIETRRELDRFIARTKRETAGINHRMTGIEIDLQATDLIIYNHKYHDIHYGRE